VGGAILQFQVRTSSCCNHISLTQFDDLLLLYVCHKWQWIPANLLVLSGGMGALQSPSLPEELFKFLLLVLEPLRHKFFKIALADNDAKHRLVLNKTLAKTGIVNE